MSYGFIPSTPYLNGRCVANGLRRDLQEVFEPVFEEIDRLIKQQVNEVRLKRLADKHPKGETIRVT